MSSQHSSIGVSQWSFIGISNELHWKLMEPYGNLQNLTQRLSYNMLISFHLKVGHQKGLEAEKYITKLEM